MLRKKILIMDIGIMNGKKFIGIAGTGYDALVGGAFQSFGSRGPIPYFLIGVREFFKYHCLNYHIRVDGEIIQTEALMITVANTREYGNGAVIAPEADPADGCLDLCLLKPQNLPGAIKAASMLFRGNINRHPGFIVKKCRTLTIEAAGQEMHIHRDGEPDAQVKEIEVNIDVGALRVCSPLGN